MPCIVQDSHTQGRNVPFQILVSALWINIRGPSLFELPRKNGRKRKGEEKVHILRAEIWRK